MCVVVVVVVVAAAGSCSHVFVSFRVHLRVYAADVVVVDAGACARTFVLFRVRLRPSVCILCMCVSSSSLLRLVGCSSMCFL